MEYKKLGDIATYINGYAFKPEDRGDEGLPIIRIQDLTGNSYDLGFYDGEYPEKIEINDGDVLISWSASLGVYVWNRGKALLNQHIFKVAFDKLDIDKNYFVYAVRRKLDEMTSKTHGATMKHIVKKDFDATQIPYPSLEEQAEIASNLDRVSRIIEVRKAELEKLDELIKARFVEMFGDPVRNPKGWNQSKLRDVSNGKLSYGSGASAIDFDGDCRYIRITDITDKGDLGKEAKSPNTYDEKYILNDGDILFARSGATVGKTFCYNKLKHGKSIFAGYLIRMIPDTNRVIPTYVYYYTKTDYYASFVDKVQRSVAQPNINAQEYGDLIICVPPIEFQNRFSEFVQQVDKSKAAIQKSLDETQVLFDSLMQKYFG